MAARLDDLGPWAVVTGASSGLGQGFARHLAAAGIDLVLAARSTGRLEALADEVARTHGVRTRVVTVDLATPSGPAHLLASTADLDVGLLVSNAGASRPGRFLDHAWGDVSRRLQLNAGQHLELAHGFAARLVSRGGGGMLLVSALGASEGIPHMADSAGAKAHVASLGESLHHELKPHGVHVTVMLPGNVDTPIMDAFAIDRDRLPMSPYPVDRAVAEAIAALRRGRSRIIPDRRMRMVSRLTPRRVRVRMNGRLLGAAADALAEREGRAA